MFCCFLVLCQQVIFQHNINNWIQIHHLLFNITVSQHLHQIKITFSSLFPHRAVRKNRYTLFCKTSTTVQSCYYSIHIKQHIWMQSHMCLWQWYKSKLYKLQTVDEEKCFLHGTHVYRWPFLIECNSIQSKCKKVTGRDSFNIIIGTFLLRQLCCKLHALNPENLDIQDIVLAWLTTQSIVTIVFLSVSNLRDALVPLPSLLFTQFPIMVKGSVFSAETWIHFRWNMQQEKCC